MTETGERVVIINDTSPDYSLTRITNSDLRVDGKINPYFSKDIPIPNYALPTKVRVICQEPFGEGVFISVGRVSPFREPGFFINETELESPPACLAPQVITDPSIFRAAKAKLLE